MTFPEPLNSFLMYPFLKGFSHRIAKACTGITRSTFPPPVLWMPWTDLISMLQFCFSAKIAHHGANSVKRERGARLLNLSQVILVPWHNNRYIAFRFSPSLRVFWDIYTPRIWNFPLRGLRIERKLVHPEPPLQWWILIFTGIFVISS